MKTNSFLKNHFLSTTLLTLPFVLIAFFWGQIPDTIPTHWNIDGEADDFGSKSSLFILPIVNIAVFLLFLVIPKIDPKKTFSQFGKTYRILVSAILGLLFLVFCVVLLMALGIVNDSTNLILYLVIGLFLIIGNYLGKVRPNYFLGIRTPWTLENEEVWVKTHRLGGKLWVIASIVMLLASFIAVGRAFAILFGIYTVIIAVVPIVYSYLAYRQLNPVNENL